MQRAVELFDTAESALKSPFDKENPIADYFVARASFVKAINSYEVTRIKDFMSRMLYIK